MYSISYNKLTAMNPCWKSTYRKAQNWLSSQQGKRHIKPDRSTEHKPISKLHTNDF